MFKSASAAVISNMKGEECNNFDVLVWTDELLVEFFELYADFNFADHGISVVAGVLVDIPDPSTAVYIENPLERDLNVAKNVLEGHIQTFQTQCRLAKDALVQSSTMMSRSRQRGSDPWGLLSILKTDDQLQLTADPAPVPTVSDDDADRDPLDADCDPMTQDDLADSDRVDPRSQSRMVGVVDIHEILRDESDSADSVADNVSNRTL